MEIRKERAGDREDIYRLNAAAFESDAEALIVDKLRGSGNLTLSLVAVEKDELVGHIAFSPVSIESESGTVIGTGLAPMAVAPELQKSGIGSRLVKAGLEELKSLGHEIVFVLGHSDYYPRFGFVPSKRFGISWEHDVPDEFFMVLELKAGSLEGVAGVVRYGCEFDEV